MKFNWVFFGLALLVNTAWAADTPWPSVEAKAAYVFDLTTGQVLFAKNPETQLPLASLTKLMTVYAAAKNGLALNKGQVCFTLATSSNEGARKIGDKLGPNPARVMNQVAHKLGLIQTFYLNPTGLDISAHLAGAYGSARDTARLLASFYHDLPELLRCSTKARTALGTGPAMPNTNPDISKTVGIVGSKTGFTDLAGGNLAVVIDAGINHPVVTIALGSSQTGRFRDVEELSQATMESLALNP